MKNPDEKGEAHPTGKTEYVFKVAVPFQQPIE